jgi:hypothetical protein
MWGFAALAGLGAFHGVNPAMGWLFAVARGLQSGERAAVLRALGPIALGHAVSVAVVIALVIALRSELDATTLQVAAAVGLIGFGAMRLARGARHRFRVGMVAGFFDLALWSFLMATAHGAGLMLAPVLLAAPLYAPGWAAWGGLLAIATHSAAMLAVMALIAWVVFDRIGLAVLRRGWINLDLLWSGALIGVGALLLLFVAGTNLPAPNGALGAFLRLCGVHA